MRIIIFSGKGGSGTSTLAAATAAALADSGLNVLAFAITRGIGDALAVDAGTEPRAAGDRLAAVEGHSGHGGPDEFRDWLQALLDWRGMDPDLSEDLAALPGVNHMGRLLELQRLAASGAYDAVVVDAAELSQFLDLPPALDAAARWLERLFERRQQTVFEPLIRAFAGDYASAGEEVFETGRELLTRLAELRDSFADPEVTSVRVVVPPEEQAVPAAEEAVAVLTLFGYRMDAVIVNGLLPETVADEFFAPTRKRQADTLARLRGAGLPMPVLASALRREPPRGSEALLEVAGQLHGGENPAVFLAEVAGHSVERATDHYLLKVALPFARREELRLEELDEGIAVHLNGRRCVLALPRDVIYTEATSWTYESGVLRVVLDR